MHILANSLGRRHHPDPRDHNFLLQNHLPATHETATLPTKKLWTISSAHLDQGPTGTCVGHGWRNFLRCLPIQTTAKKPSAYDIYRDAVLLDPWSDNDDEHSLPDGDPDMDSGTTVRAGAKALANRGKLTSYAWAFDLKTATQWVLTKGPVVLGTNWYQSMFSPDAKGLVTIAPGSSIAGGHCYLWRGVDTVTGLARLTNSWGSGWARYGDFYLSLSDLERLILEDGEVCTAVQRSA